MMPSQRCVGLLVAAVILFSFNAQAWSEPTVLVRLARLQKGSLPRIVTAYGRVEAGPAATRSVMAPLSATVMDVDVRPGQAVGRSAPLLGLGPTPAMVASYTQAVSALRVATELVSHTRQLVSQHLATTQQLADTEKARSDARATLDALRAQGADGPRILRAPFPAIVIAVAVTPGSIVAEGSPMLPLARATCLALRVGLVPDEAMSVAPGDKVTVTPIGGGAALQGSVSLRGAMVRPEDGLVPIDVSVPTDHLFLGEMAEASIVTGQVSGYVVPHEAILVNDQSQTYVVQSENMIARKVPVRVLGSQGGQDVITGALDAAAPLVLAGNYQLDDGMKMRVAPAGGEAAP